VCPNVQHVILYGSFAREVVNEYRVLLADPVEPSDALLHLHGIPREVIVDDSVSKLQIATLAASLGGNENLGGPAKRSDRSFLLVDRH